MGIESAKTPGAEELYFINIPSALEFSPRKQLTSETPASVEINTASRTASGVTDKTYKNKAR
jgi:hypothetical protein